jgi:DNA end-binding protein Ku
MLGQEVDTVGPGQSRSMEIRASVDLDDIDPIYFNKTYYLGPGGEGNRRGLAAVLA